VFLIIKAQRVVKKHVDLTANLIKMVSVFHSFQFSLRDIIH
jgi:hypothetical protein